MTSKDKIIKRLRSSRCEKFPKPNLEEILSHAIHFEDALSKFIESAKASGADVIVDSAAPAEGPSVLRAEFGVAENGAVWITCTLDEDRRNLFRHDELSVIFDKEKIVDNMNLAYKALAGKCYDYGCFISGPSKTADIEQALVLGAHGSRKFTIYIQ